MHAYRYWNKPITATTTTTTTKWLSMNHTLRVSVMWNTLTYPHTCTLCIHVQHTLFTFFSPLFVSSFDSELREEFNVCVCTVYAHTQLTTKINILKFIHRTYAPIHMQRCTLPAFIRKLGAHRIKCHWCMFWHENRCDGRGSVRFAADVAAATDDVDVVYIWFGFNFYGHHHSFCCLTTRTKMIMWKWSVGIGEKFISFTFQKSKKTTDRSIESLKQ